MSTRTKNFDKSKHKFHLSHPRSAQYHPKPLFVQQIDSFQDSRFTKLANTLSTKLLKPNNKTQFFGLLATIVVNMNQNSSFTTNYYSNQLKLQEPHHNSHTTQWGTSFDRKTLEKSKDKIFHNPKLKKYLGGEGSIWGWASSSDSSCGGGEWSRSGCTAAPCTFPHGSRTSHPIKESGKLWNLIHQEIRRRQRERYRERGEELGFNTRDW